MLCDFYYKKFDLTKGLLFKTFVMCDFYYKKFDLTKGLLFKTFVFTVWYKFCRCDHSVLEFKSFSLLMSW